MSLHLTRQLDVIDMNKTIVPVTIIGAGAIGSFVALSLAKMGFDDIEVWDYDKIEVENMNCQFYRFTDIGKFKTDALHSLVKDFTEVDLKVKCQRFNPGDRLRRGIVIAAVDSMRVRADLFAACVNNINVTHFIDMRMTAESCMMYTVKPNNPTDVKYYQACWYPDDEAVAERCTAKSTMYCVLAIASQCCSNVKAIVMGQKVCRSVQWDVGKFDYLSFMEKGEENADEGIVTQTKPVDVPSTAKQVNA